jgi:hypothetical protein
MDPFRAIVTSPMTDAERMTHDPCFAARARALQLATPAAPHHLDFPRSAPPIGSFLTADVAITTPLAGWELSGSG